MMGGSLVRMASLPRWAVNEPKVAELEVGDAIMFDLRSFCRAGRCAGAPSGESDR
jgi:hypothetical protein